MAHPSRGATLVEVLIAIVVLTIGLLGHVATTVLVGHAIARSERSAAAALAADERLERLRSTTCATRSDGAEIRSFHRAPVDSLSWRSIATGARSWRLLVRSHYLVGLNHWRTDSIATEIWCVG